MTVFSERGICQSKSDTSVVVIPASVAKEIAKDLIRLDSAKKELELCASDKVTMSKSLALKDSIIVIKDSVISIMKNRDTNFVSIIENKDKQAAAYKELAIQNERMYKAEKRKRNTMNAITSALVIIGIVFAFQ